MLPSRVIDLDRPRPAAPGRRDPHLARRGRHTALLAGAVVLFVLIALTGMPALGQPLTLAWRGGTLHAMLWVDDRSVYGLRPGLQGPMLTANDIATGTIRWQRELTGPLARMYPAESPMLVPLFGPHVPARASIAASSTRTGRLHGIYPVPAMPLVYFTDPVAVVVDLAPGTVQAGLRPAGPNQVGTGTAGVGSTFDGWVEEHLVVAIDLETGATRWSRRIPAGSTWAMPGVHPWRDGFVGEPGPAPWMVVVGADGAAETWRLATGEVAARADVGPLVQWSYASALPGTVLINTGGWPNAIVDAYEPDELTRLWRSPVPTVPDVMSWPVLCASLICLMSTSDIWAVDLAPRRLAWHRAVVDVYAVGHRSMAVATLDGPVLLDLATGAVDAVPDGWRVAERRGREGPVVLAVHAGGRTTLGLLDLDGGTPRTLGDVGEVGLPERCAISGAHLACATADEVRVWRMRGPR
jgi:hypothetical protein